MLIKDIRKNLEIMNSIRFDLTPEIVGKTRQIKSGEDYERVIKDIEAMAGYYFYVDVWNCQARLALMHNNPDGSGRSEVITDFPDQELVNAVEETGSAINISGHYPINNRIEKLIFTILKLEE